MSLKKQLSDAFDRAQESYTQAESDFLDLLGPVGRFWKKRIKKSFDVPDWKRVQRIWIWITILAFVVGMVVAGQYYQVQCNTHIVEEFYPEKACLLGLKCNMSEVLYTGDDSSLEGLPLFGMTGDGK